MRAELRDRLITPQGEMVPEGTRVVMLESILKWEVTPVGSAETFAIPRDDLRVACEAPGCAAEAEYEAPGHWCSVHWNEWWEEDDDSESETESEKAPHVTLKKRIENNDEILFPEGTSVFPRGKRLAIRISLNDCEFEVDRSILSIQCEVDDCEEEAAIWHPCYCCRKHYFDWANGKILLPNTTE